MYKGTTVDELMMMVEQAERHAHMLLEETHELELIIANQAAEVEALAGVA
jgi:hypothetical protein